MSLLDAFLEDGLLETVVQSDVWIALRSDGVKGAGTRDNPFNGATDLDSVMDDIGPNTTIRLGPGEFTSQGGEAWQPKSGQRILGAGIHTTTIKVNTASPGADIVAIGKPIPDEFLAGFELSDLTIDCDLSNQGSAYSVGGISVTGSHIRLRRVAVVNFGRKNAGLCVGISAAWARAANPQENEEAFAPLDCVVDECLVTPDTSSYAYATLVCLRLGSSAAAPGWHTACVIRDCYVDGGDTALTKDIRGIEASGGIGTIVQGNRIRNCQYGGPYLAEGENQAVPIRDLWVLDNWYANVREGVSLNPYGEVEASRIMVLNNTFELGAPGSVFGIKLTRTDPGDVRFDHVVLRRNLIRYGQSGQPASSDYGMYLNSCTNAIIEDNIVDVGSSPDKAVYHSSCPVVKPFNNQTSAGDFRPGYDADTQRHDAELTTDVEDVLLGI